MTVWFKKQSYAILVRWRNNHWTNACKPVGRNHLIIQQPRFTLKI